MKNERPDPAVLEKTMRFTFRLLIKPRSILSIIIALCLLSGCAVFEAPPPVFTQQPGDYFGSQIKQDNLSTPTEIESLLKAPNPFSSSTNEVLTSNIKQTARLLSQIQTDQDVQRAVIGLAEEKPDFTEQWVYLALELYPNDAYRIFEELYLDSSLSESTIESAALLANLEPSRLFPPSASGDLEYRITPLIHSASVTVFNQNETRTNKTWFKPTSSPNWQKALALQWEPISSALSGSIVRLQPDTLYDVKIELFDTDGLLGEKLLQFKTRANKPPIDPQKIYNLSDIYSGGQLDLEALGIEGSETGWAKIVGDGTEIIAGENDISAINMGRQNYVVLENIVVKGGIRYGIYAYKSHHIWIDGCNISRWGRTAGDIRDGVGYHNEQSTSPINYDAGIYLERSGVVVIENCDIHNPNGKANHWGDGHPKGPNALQVWGHQDIDEYRGQYIVRYNRFYGSPDKRFNDVIEGRSNFKRHGGFTRDSAIHDNYLAYANDDLIEIDGGQSNVLVYNNEMTQGYAGISTAPNMIGPSYLFNNYIHNLGDERGKEWTAIKMGGLISAPAGITNVFENLIITNRNGISASRVRNDSTFWVNARNNIIINRKYNNLVGLGVYDVQLYPESTFVNNFIFNTQAQEPVYQALDQDNFLHPDSHSAQKADNIANAKHHYLLSIQPEFLLNNFSRSNYTEESNRTVTVGIIPQQNDE